MEVIDVGRDFYRYPGGRYYEDGEGNATEFREKFLVPVLKQKKRAKIIIDSVIGYSASFLDEAFGGLISEEGFEAEEVLEAFDFEAKKRGYKITIELIKRYIRAAGKQKSPEYANQSRDDIIINEIRDRSTS